MMLPKEFIDYTKEIFGAEKWERFVASFDEPAPVSVRINPFKAHDIPSSLTEVMDAEVPYCKNAFYLTERPQFTLDPTLHAGAYYVQEAGSMFLDAVLRNYVSQPVTMLDLCASPGGKSTLSRATLPEGSLLFANEPDHHRANILLENIQKQGHTDVVVTNNYAIDYQRSRLRFDVILTDVPCSGEGMFRRDNGAISEWSISNVQKCWQLQRSIVEDVWPCLCEGGLLIYSTCTFNLHEDEENVRWICENLGAEVLSVETEASWNITGSLLEGWNEPVYRFIPGTTRSEGLFMAVLRKKSNGDSKATSKDNAVNTARKKLRVMYDGKPVGTQKGKDTIPAHAEALSIATPLDRYPHYELSLEDALRYLRREALVLPPDVNRGYVIVCYQGFPLGFVKNIGNRANNLYPQEWKIRQV